MVPSRSVLLRLAPCLACLSWGCTVIGGVDEFTDAADGAGGDSDRGPSSGSLRPDQDSPSGGSGSSNGSTTSGCGDGCDPGEEDCSNGVDDNDDGLADCADPICGGLGYACVPSVPAGWFGPAIVSETDPSSGCSGAFATEVALAHRGLQAEAAVCDACSCEADGDGTCGPATLVMARTTGGGCAAACEANVQLDPDSCEDLGAVAFPCGSSQGVFSSDSITVPNWSVACIASAQSPMLPEISWQADALVCRAPAGGGCGGDAVCAPPPPASATDAVCIAAAGEGDCPSAYPLKTVLYEGFDDGRDCTDCSCAAQPCVGEVEFFFGENCGGGAKEDELGAPFAGACNELIDADGQDDEDDRPRARFRPDDDAPKCAPVASQPTGAATGVGPTTVCCME